MADHSTGLGRINSLGAHTTVNTLAVEFDQGSTV